MTTSGSFSVLLPSTALLSPPRLVAAAGEHASMRFIEFFTARIRNPNTRQAYLTAVLQFTS